MAAGNSANINILINTAMQTAQAMQEMKKFSSDAGKELDKLWSRKTDSQVFKSMLVAIKQVELAVQALNTTMSSKMNSLASSANNAAQSVSRVKEELNKVNGTKSTATVDVKINTPKGVQQSVGTMLKGGEIPADTRAILTMIREQASASNVQMNFAQQYKALKSLSSTYNASDNMNIFGKGPKSIYQILEEEKANAEAANEIRRNAGKGITTITNAENLIYSDPKQDPNYQNLKQQIKAKVKRWNDEQAKIEKEATAEWKTAQGRNVTIYGPKQIDSLLMGGDKSTLEQMKQYYSKIEKVSKSNAEMIENYNLKARGQYTDVRTKKVVTPQPEFGLGDYGQMVEDEFSMKNFAEATARLARYYASFAAIQGSIGVINNLSNEIYKIQEGMIGIEKYISPLSTMAPLWANVATQAGKFGVEITDVISAYETFAQQGLRSNQIIQATSAALLSANVSGTDFKESVTFITTATRVYGEEVSQATKYVDMLAAVQAKSSVNADQMIAAFQRSGAQAKQAGISMSFLLGMYAAITEKTQQSGEVTGTGVRTITERLQRQSTIKALSGIGPLSDISFANQAGDLTSAEVILKKLAERWSSLTEAQQKYVSYTISGGRQINTFLALMSNFDMVLAQNQNALNSFGFASAANEKEMNKLSKQLMILKDSAIATANVFGGALYSAFTAILKAINALNLGFVAIASISSALALMTGAVSLKLLIGEEAFVAITKATYAWAVAQWAALSPLQMIGIAIGTVIAVAAGWSVLDRYFGDSATKAAALNEELTKVAQKIQETINLGNKASAMKIFREFAEGATSAEKDEMIALGAQMIKSGGKISIAPTEANMELFVGKYGTLGKSTTNDVVGLFRDNPAILEQIGNLALVDKSKRAGMQAKLLPSLFKEGTYTDLSGFTSGSPTGEMIPLSTAEFNKKFNKSFDDATVKNIYKQLLEIPSDLYQTLSSLVKPEAQKAEGKINKDLDEMVSAYIDQAKAQVVQKSHSWKQRTFTNFDENVELFRETVAIRDDLQKKRAVTDVNRISAIESGDIEKAAKYKRELDEIDQSLNSVSKSIEVVRFRLTDQGKAIVTAVTAADNAFEQLGNRIQDIIGYANKTWDFKFNFIAFLTDMLPGWFKAFMQMGPLSGLIKNLSGDTAANKKELLTTDLGTIKTATAEIKKIDQEMSSLQEKFKARKNVVAGSQVAEQYAKDMTDLKIRREAEQKKINEAGATQEGRDLDEVKKQKQYADAVIDINKQIIQNAASNRNKAGGAAGRSARIDAKDRIQALEDEQSVIRSLRNEWLKFDTSTKFSSKWRAQIEELTDRAKELRDIVAKLPNLPEDDKKRMLLEAGRNETKAKFMQTQEAEVKRIEAAQQRQKIFFKDEEEKLRNKLSLQQEYAKVSFSMKYAPSILEKGAFELQMQKEKIAGEEAVLALKKQEAYEAAVYADVNKSLTAEKYNQIALEDEAVKTQQNIVNKEKERLGLIEKQTEAKIRQKANQGVSEVQGIIGGALFDMLSLKGREGQKEQVRAAMKEIAKLQAEAGTASYGVAEAETTGSIDKINSAREKWSQVNQQLKEAQDKMNDINNKTNKWKEVLQNIADVIIKKITEKFAEMLMKNTGLDNILGSLFGGIEGIGGGRKGSSNAVGGGIGALLAGGGQMFAGLPTGAQSVLGMAGGFLNTASNGSIGNILSAFTGRGSSATSSAGGGLFGGGIGQYLAPAAIGFGLGSTQKSKGGGALAGALGGLMSGGLPGAVIGAIAGLFGADDEEEKAPEPAREFYPLAANTSALDRNTSALMKLSEGTFNAPSVFNMNKLQAEANSPRVTINSLTINAGAGVSAKAIANEISNIGAAYSQSVNRMSTVSNQWG